MKRASWALVFALALITPADSFGKTDKPKKAKQDVEQIGERDVGKGINFYSIEKEIALGKQLAQQIERTAKIVDDPVIAEYVNRVGQNLVRNSDAKVPFTIKVIDNEEVNAKPFERIELLARVRSLLRVKTHTDELERAEAVVLTLARGIEGRDPCTEGHCER